MGLFRVKWGKLLIELPGEITFYLLVKANQRVAKTERLIRFNEACVVPATRGHELFDAPTRPG